MQLVTQLGIREVSGIGDINIVALFFRHFGVGRNPVASMTYWIPAYAGMTNLKLVGQQCLYRLKCVNSQVQIQF